MNKKYKQLEIFSNAVFSLEKTLSDILMPSWKMDSIRKDIEDMKSVIDELTK